MIDRKGIWCGLLAILAVAMTIPILEGGVNDDWSYARTALDLSLSGKLIYNGWATAMLGWQAYWGALVIRIFGFSFLALRLSTTLLAGICAYLIVDISKKLGLNSRNAILCSLTVVLCPVFIPSAASFATDVPGLLFILLCVYSCTRALTAREVYNSILWLLSAFSFSLIGGTGRQTDWLGILVMLPAAAWLLRSKRAIIPAVTVLWLAGVLFIALAMSWFRHQPYSIPEQNPVADGLHMWMFSDLFHNLFAFVATGFLMCLPALVPYVATLKGSSKMVRRVVWGTAILTPVFGLALKLHLAPPKDIKVLAPWARNNFLATGVMDSDGLGQKPVVLGLSIRVILTSLLIFSLFSFIAFILKSPRCGSLNHVTRILPWRSLAFLFAPFVLAYLILLVPRAMLGGVFDRYLFPLLPMMLIPILRLYQERWQANVPNVAFGVLAVTALYSVAATHDFFSMERARLAAISSVLSAGNPRTAIEGGFEYDGWTQLQVAGYINDPRIEIPKGAYHVNPHNTVADESCEFWFSDSTPAVKPKYYIVFSPLPCFAPSNFKPVSYQAWLPPWNRKIYIQTGT